MDYLFFTMVVTLCYNIWYMTESENFTSISITVPYVYSKISCSKAFLKTFRGILYNSKLSKLARLMALIMIDSPPKENPKWSVYARKFDISAVTMSKILKEFRNNGILMPKLLVKQA